MSGPPGTGPTDDGLRCAIDEVQAEFAWAVDRQRFDDLAALFTPDAVFSTGGRRFVGREAIRDRYAGRSAEPGAAGARVTRHLYSGLRLTSRAAESVHTTSLWVCFAANAVPAPPGTPPLYMVADFEDTFRRCDDGRWRIAERTIHPVFRDPTIAPVG